MNWIGIYRRLLRTALWTGLSIGAFGATDQASGQTATCGAEAYNPELMSNPDYAAMMQLLESAYQTSLGQSPLMGGTGDYIIPCVVHILYDNQILDPADLTTDAENTPDQAVINAICLTNKYLAGQDGSGVQVGPDTHIQLRLATLDPLGDPTTGIIHHQVTASCAGIGAPPSCYTINDLQSQFGWDQASYLNIFSVDLLYGGLGLAGTFTNITVDNAALNFPHDHALQTTKTLVHEAGHYFNLLHVGVGACHDPANCATAGDHVCDTEQAFSNYSPNGNTYVPVASDCVQETGFWPKHDLMSYAHYTSHRFTLGQIVRMTSALQTPAGQSHWSATNLISTGTADPYSMSCCTLAMTLSIVQPTCPNSGSISIAISGANGLTTIRWFNDTQLISGQSGTTLAGLAPGYYDVQVYDAGGCFVWSHVELVNGQPIALNGTPYPACNSGNTGAIDLTASGGTGTFSYQWSGPGGYSSTAEDPSGLAAGAYSVTVTDGSGCTANLSVTVGNSVVQLASMVTDAACSTAQFGAIDITPSGGAPPYSYSWSNSATSQAVTDLAVGSYTVTVQDANGCSTQQTFNIIDVSPCCAADLFIPTGTLSSSLGTSIGAITVDIQGQFIIDNDFTFNGTSITMEPAAEIIVQDGATLNLNGTTIHSCQGVMWKGITVQNGGGLYSYGSFIEDAENAVIALDGSTIVSDNTQFHNNRVGINIPDVGGTWSNVAMAVSNSQFYSSGALALPYSGQTTLLGQVGFAAIDGYNAAIDLTGGGNIIHDLSNGVVAHRCHVFQGDVDLQNIQPDAAYVFPGNGSGVYARGDHGFFDLKVNNSLFDNCRWGVYTEYMNVSSQQNQMNYVGTGYHVELSSYKDIDILNNTLDTRYDGIQLYMNDGCAHMLVDNNDITFATNPPPGQFVKGYTAIKVLEANTMNLNSVIQNNTIHYRAGASTAHSGIYLGSASDFQVLGNTLLMHNNAVNYAGVFMSGCERTLVSCNDVHGSSNNYNVDDGQSAIRNNLGRQPTIYCNTVDGTTNGIYFSGTTHGTDLGGNNINHHKWGLHLDYNAVIDAQTLKGNLWYNAPEPGGQQAWCEQAANAVNSPFFCDLAWVGSGNPFPPFRDPLNWFSQYPGQNYRCDTHGGSYCAQFAPEKCEDCKTALDEKIASDSLQNDPYTDETKWMLKGDLYKKVDDHPDMLSDQELADFYNEMQGTTTAQFKLINDDYLKVFDLDASIRNYLDQNRDELNSLMAQLKDAMAQLADPSLTSAQRQALNTTVSGLQQSISDLTALNEQALQAAATTKNLTAEAIKNNNASVGTTALIEDNEKEVNDIYLRTVAQDVDNFNAVDASALFNIANQCPMVGGNAVYRARSLYALIDDDQEYDDPALCLSQGIIVRSMQAATAPQQTVQLVPNPARDEVTLVFAMPFEGISTVVFYDALGHEVLRQRLSGDQQRFHLSVAALAPAVYHYKAFSPYSEIGNGKLTVVR